MKITATLSEMDKLIITVAITGGIHGKESNPNLPEQPDEQVRDVYDCYNAGASIVHLHIRDKQGVCSGDLGIFKEVLSKIKAKCEIVTQVGNGIGFYYDDNGDYVCHSYETRMGLLEIEPKPDIITLNAGTFHFGKALFPNSSEFNEEFVKRANERNIPIECEVYDIGHVANVMQLVDKGVLKKPIHFSFVLGIEGGIPATHENMLRLVAEIPEGAYWQVISISKYQLPLTVAAMSMGANIRTGLEDNVYYSTGGLAESNAQLVERVVKIAREFGREIATVDDAKKTFGIED